MCRLKRALYRMKQAPKAWYGQIDSYLQKMGFVKSDADPNLYYLMVEGEPLILDRIIAAHRGLQEEHGSRV